MAVNLSPYGGVGAQFLDNSGNVLTGGKIYTYAAGTTTPQVTYTSGTGAVAHSNPIILDASGRVPSGEIWLTDGLSYKFVLTTSADVLIATYDGITGINSNFVSFVNQQEIQTATAGQTVFNLTTMTYQPGTNSLSVFVDGVNQYGPGSSYAYLETDSDTVTFVTGLHVGAEVKFTTSNLNSSASVNDAEQISYIPPFTGSVATNVEAKLAQYVSVKDFGAVGDGITDDTAAFVSAAASGSVAVYVPDGTYIVSSFTLNGQKLFGSATLKWKASTSTPMITLSGDGCKITGLTFDGNGANQSSSTELITFSTAPNATIQNNIFKDGRYKCILTDVAVSTGVSIKDNKFIDWGTIGSCDVVSFRSPNYIASGNYFENIGDGHCIRTGLFNADSTAVPVSNGTICGNVFFNTLHVGVTCELYTQGLTITGNTFEDLEAGVKIEATGGNQKDITIDGNVFKNLANVSGTVLNITGNNVIFSNNSVRDCDGSCDVGSNSIVSNNVFDNCGSLTQLLPAIRVSSSGFTQSIATGNIVVNSPYRAISAGADSVVTNNVIKTCADIAISLGSADRARVAQNLIDGCTYGILANSTSQDLFISGNDVRNASVSAYSIVDTSTAYIDNNNFGYSLSAPVLTIASGSVTAPRRYGATVRIDTEGAAATDDLDTIAVQDGGQIGFTLVLGAASAARVVTVKDGTGNLRLAGDFVMNSTDDRLLLIFNGTNWVELSRSDNS